MTNYLSLTFNLFFSGVIILGTRSFLKINFTNGLTLAYSKKFYDSVAENLTFDII